MPFVRKKTSYAALATLGMVLTCTSVVAADYVYMPLADGFDFPVGKPDSDGYYKARGFWPNGHMGEDWNGKGGGNTDLGDPVYSIGDGVVVQSRDVRVGWGNVVIIRHVFRDNDGEVRYIDSLYGHLNTRKVVLNQRVKRGQLVGTIGTNRGMYLAHLHLETRKNLYIGMHRSSFDKTYANYHSPTSFIQARRQLSSTSKLYKVPINTFAPYPGGKPVANNGQTPTIASGSGSAFTIPVARTRPSSPAPSSTPKRPAASSQRPSASPKPKLDPKVQRIISESSSATTKPPQPKPERRGLLSRLRSRYADDRSPSKSPTRRRGFGRR